MTRIIHTVMVSIDGIADGPGDAYERINWFRADEEWLRYSVELLDSVNTLIFGRVTFEGMEAHWPIQDDPVAQRMNARTKIGFSRTPRHTTWQNARWSASAVDDVAALRQHGEGAALVMGSATLAAALAAAGLIDEFRYAVNPVVLGAGTPLYPQGQPRLELDRQDLRVFASGIVELRCTPRPSTIPDPEDAR